MVSVDWPRLTGDGSPHLKGYRETKSPLSTVLLRCVVPKDEAECDAENREL